MKFLLWLCCGGGGGIFGGWQCVSLGWMVDAALPPGMYDAVGDLPFLVKKLREYLGRCGGRAKL